MKTPPEIIDRSFRADLHCHSLFSDGTLTPEALVDLAKEKGLNALALTDHDTVEGIERAAARAQEVGIGFLSGVEITANAYGHSLHILAYGIDPSHQPFSQFLQDQVTLRKARMAKMIERLALHGLKIDPAVFAEQKGAIGRVHLALELVRLGYVDRLQEAFDRWIGDRAPCYENGIKTDPGSCIRHIHEAGGKAFIAHPHLAPHKSHALKVVKDWAWDGLEGYYSRLPLFKEREWIELAHRRNILISGGSDFHGSVKPHIELGCSWVNEELYGKIIEGTYWQKRQALA